MIKRVIVCGGRDYRDFETLARTLTRLHREIGPFCVVHGNARGADSLAHEWAILAGDVLAEPFPAHWREHGRAAGAIRNQAMLDAGADLVIAFPGGRGTADMVRRAKKAGVPVREFSR